MFILNIFQRCHINNLTKALPRRYAFKQNVALSSTFKRPQLKVPRDQLQSLRIELFLQRCALSHDEWQDVQQQLTSTYKHITASNVDTVIIGLCSEPQQLPLAKDYVRHLRANGKEPNAATLGRLLRVYNALYHANGANEGALSAKEQQEVLSICDALRMRYEVLDATSCENLIYGLVATTRWREAEELLQMCKLSSTPSVNAYSELLMKAFSEGEMQMGKRLLQEMVAVRKQPKCVIWKAYLKAIAKDKETFVGQFEWLMQFLGEQDILITTTVGEYIKELLLQVPSAGLTSELTKVSKKAGKCASCGLQLQPIAISDLEFARLSNSFLNKVLIRNDVFQKSTPEEVQHFKRFVTQTAPYDCVIDGLNVAYSMGAKKSPALLAKLLANVVQYFVEKQNNVLVLGRKHMHKWPKDIMQYIRKNAKLFLTNNLSHDDPFLLYATLKSGPHTDFCSRDFMRQHAFLLGPELRMVFRRWQQQHQYTLLTQTEGGKIIMKEPIRYLISSHRVENSWHIPCKEEYSVNASDIYDLPEHWLCIKYQKIN